MARASARRRLPIARHGRLGSPSPLRQLLATVAVAIAVVLVAAVAVGAYSVLQLTTKLAEKAVALPGETALPPDIGAIEGGFNLVLTGIDSCDAKTSALMGNRCKGPDAGDNLNDVTMLVHISAAPRRVTVVSFPRDLMTNLPVCTDKNGRRVGGGFGQFNTTYAYGGLACVVQEVENLTGQDVQGAAMVTFGGVVDITNAIGGVQVCLATGIRDSYTGIDWPAGTRTIQGFEALQFLRTRHGLQGGGDLSRISNQQQYMSKLARKLISGEVLSNPATLYRLASVTLDNVTPTTSIANPTTLMQIALAVRGVSFEDIAFVQYPVVAYPADHNRVIANPYAAEALWTALKANQPLVLTGGKGQGAVEATPAPGATTPAPGTTTPAPTGGASAAPAPAATLPPGVTGSNAADDTCSAGNLRH